MLLWGSDGRTPGVVYNPLSFRINSFLLVSFNQLLLLISKIGALYKVAGFFLFLATNSLFIQDLPKNI